MPRCGLVGLGGFGLIWSVALGLGRAWYGTAVSVCSGLVGLHGVGHGG